MSNRQKVFYLLVIFNTLILVWLVFKAPITNHIRKHQIKNNASLANITEVYAACKDTNTDQELNECHQARLEYKYLEEKFNALIDANTNINCDIFENKTEARQFYEYIGGLNLDIVSSSIKHPDAITRYLQTYKQRYDPYDLDKNNDGFPCESLENN